MTEPTDDEQSPVKLRFRRSKAARMPADQARRQGAIATLAFTALGSRDTALDFLNTHDATSDARPIDTATGSDEGFEQVRVMIADRARDG